MIQDRDLRSCRSTAVAKCDRAHHDHLVRNLGHRDMRSRPSRAGNDGATVLGGRRFMLRRVAFPENPPPEWFAVDLREHAEQAGAPRAGIADALDHAVDRGQLDRKRALDMARRFGRKATSAPVASRSDTIAA